VILLRHCIFIQNHRWYFANYRIIGARHSSRGSSGAKPSSIKKAVGENKARPKPRSFSFQKVKTSENRRRTFGNQGRMNLKASSSSSEKVGERKKESEELSPITADHVWT
jgi:hypothetical protein